MGQVIGGRWTLERRLGSGVTAVVYQARDPEGATAAIKLLFPHMAADEEVRRRFAQEARVVSRLEHPGIVKIIDHDVAGIQDRYIAFEYLEGQTLAQRAEDQPIAVDELLQITWQIVDALAAAHEHGVVHRDLKPSNVFLVKGNGVRILDFGVARITGTDRTSIGTQVGLAIGTVAYMAPEQALGKHDSIDGRTDLYSLGAMLFRLLAGEPVHAATTALEALQMAATVPPRSLKQLCPELPEGLVAVVDMCLAFSQSARYDNARVMQRDLRALRMGEASPVADQARSSRELETMVPNAASVNLAQAVAATVMAIDSSPDAGISPNAATEFEGSADTAEQRDADAYIGKVLAGRYRVDALLGMGGMGVVFRAEHVHMKKNVALKLLHRNMTALPEVVARFEREAVAAARIDHPHVASAKDFGKLEDGSFYLALEYVHGTSLRRLLKDKGPLEPELACTLVRQVASALSAAHRLGIVHRDLKPENIMLHTKAGGAHSVKVLDFGIAKLTREDTAREPQLTLLGTVFGTPAYMSPEQAMGSEVNAKSDVYSLGVILYEMLAGKTPFAGGDMMAVLTGHLTEVPPALPPSVPAQLALFTSELLTKQAAERPSAEQTLERLGQLGLAASQSDAPKEQNHLKRVLSTVRRVRDHWGPRLERRLHAAGLRVPLWLAASVAFGSMGAGVILVVAIQLASADDEVGLRDTMLAAPKSMSSPPVAVDPASIPDSTKEEVARIEALPVYKRKYDDWLKLARGTASMGRYKESALAYQAVLSLKASMRDDPRLLQDLRKAAYDAETFKFVVNLCATRLKRSGVDLLWQLWLEFRQDPKRSEEAELLLKKLVVLSRRASKELRVAIELQTVKTCSGLQPVVERATKHSDERSVERLLELKQTKGCGPTKDGDCYPCLRHDDALARAMSHARSRPAPRFP